MKKYLVIPVIVLAFFAITANAQTSCKITELQIAKSVSKAFESKKLGSLDSSRVSKTPVTIKMENSLADDGAKGQFVTRQFKSLKAAENWFTKREIDELPGRNSPPLIGCKKGSCTFESNGLLHNNLYLKRINLGYTKEKCPYIKLIYIVDGN
jgi:hypothetical protein